MARYEFNDGGSAKFWEVAVDGATLTVRFGRIGTQGQAKSKDFASPAAAEREEAKLIKEKTGKGYVLAGEASPAPVSAAAAAAIAPSPDSRPPAASEAPTLAPLTTEKPGRLFDTPALPSRTRPHAFGPMQSAWDNPGQIDESDPKVQAEAEFSQYTPQKQTAQEVAVRVNTALGWLAALFDGSSPTSLAVEQIADHYRKLRGYYADRAIALRLEGHGGILPRIIAFAQQVVATEGALVALQAVDHAWTSAQQSRVPYATCWSDPVALALRMVLSQLPEAEYEAALAWCLEQRAARPGWEWAAQFALILADDRPGAGHALQPLAVLQEAVRQGVDIAATAGLLPLVAEAPPAAAAAWRVRRSYHFYFAYSCVTAEQAAATAIAAARTAGESALPALSWLLYYGHDDERTAIALALLETGEAGALVQLLPLLHEKWIRQAVERAADAAPALLARQGLGALASGRVEPVIRARVMEQIQRHGPVQMRAWTSDLDAKATRTLEELIGAGSLAPAPREAWPQVLQAPPWRQKPRKASEEIILELAPLPTPFAYVPSIEALQPQPIWLGGEPLAVADLAQLPEVIREIEGARRQAWNRAPDAEEALPPTDAPSEDVLGWLGRRLEPLDPWRIRSTRYSHLYYALDQQPGALARMLWELTPVLIECGLRWYDATPAMLSRFGAAAVPGLVKVIEAEPVLGLTRAAEVDAAAIAPGAARALLRLKKARDPAAAWLRRHARTAMTRLVPDAVGKPGEAREAAEHALRWLRLAVPDGPALLDAAIASYAQAEPRVAQAIGQVLHRDPLARVPGKIAKLPAWFSPAALTRPALRSGGVLPDEAMAAVAEMLSFSTPDAVYAGIPMLREAATPESLGAFAWDLFSAWLAAGAPSKDGWAMRAIGWLGDDDCARQLTRLIRKWPGEAAHARAVTGLDVLADIGTDVALMHLNGIAEKLKFKGLQEKARERIAALAETRGLTPEDLADRLAPDLDLNERGGLDLDFGPRQFRVGFDEFLKPWVKDTTGTRLKDLPKANKADDAERAGAAVARWTAVKKDARAIASLQIVRLEALLATCRRLHPAVFRTCFAAHPLIRHLAQRLVWGVYDDAVPLRRPRQSFRVTEELSLTDAGDDPVDIDLSEAATGLIGLVHPLQMREGELEAWGRLFGDYEIAQPFPQLGRETFTLTAAEKDSARIERFKGKSVQAARLRGMGVRGWPLGAPQDGGAIHWLERPLVLADGRTCLALQYFGDGLFAGAVELEEKIQRLETLELRSEWGVRREEAFRFADLDAVTASEMLRAISLLAEAGTP